MDKRDLGITIGICASLVAHVGMLTYSADRYAHSSLYYPSGYRRLPGVLISLKPKDLPIPPPPLPPQPVDIGDIKGIGDADFDSPGDIPLSARQADETQAWYTVHKSGERSANSSNASNDPLRGDNGRGGPRSPAAQALAEAIRQIENPAPVRTPRPQLKPKQNPAKPRPAAPASPPALSLAVSPMARLMIPSTTRPSPHVEIAAAPVPLAPLFPTPPTPPTDTPPPTASGDGLKPGGAPSSGDPAPHSDTDSDPFSVAGGVVFHNGKTTKRFGRKARLTDPHLTIAGDWDAFAMGTPRMVLKISIDATGNVTDVEILKSSGRPDTIDLPTQVAAQNWWFEPRKDAKGHPVPDSFPFPVEYR